MVYPRGAAEETGGCCPIRRRPRGPAQPAPGLRAPGLARGSTLDGCRTAGFLLKEAEFLKNKGGSPLHRSGSPGGSGGERQEGGSSAIVCNKAPNPELRLLQPKNKTKQKKATPIFFQSTTTDFIYATGFLK